MNNIFRILIFAVLGSTAATANAHPGGFANHRLVGAMHYFTDPYHAVITILVVAVFLSLVFWLRRRLA